MLPEEFQFGTQAETWLRELEEFKRKRGEPLALATKAAFNCYIRRLVPLIGADKPLSEINSGTLREVVDKLMADKMSAKTIAEILAVAKQVVASVVTTNGDPVFAVQWNSKHIGCPSIKNQNRPCPTREQIEAAILGAADYQEQVLIAVLAGSGLRISECLAIHVNGSEHQSVWSAEASSINVRATIYLGRELRNHTKTDAAARWINLHPSLNRLIADFVRKAGRQPGDFLFQDSDPTRPLAPRCVLKRMHKSGVDGFHSLRRWRATIFDAESVPPGLTRVWLGHAAKDVTERYVTTAGIELRKTWAEKVPLGFSLAQVGVPRPDAPLPPQPPPPSKPKKKRRHRKSFAKRFKIEPVAPNGFVAQEQDLNLQPMLPERAESLQLQPLQKILN